MSEQDNNESCEPFDQNTIKEALKLAVELAYSVALIKTTCHWVESVIDFIGEQPRIDYLSFGWSESNLVELDYLNDSIIPNDKALTV